MDPSSTDAGLTEKNCVPQHNESKAITKTLEVKKQKQKKALKNYESFKIGKVDGLIPLPGFGSFIIKLFTSPSFYFMQRARQANC